MPEYKYRCEDSHDTTVQQSMTEDALTECPICGRHAWRVPQPVAVNWNGLPPSKGGIDPLAQRLIDTAPERRDEYERRHTE